jgi:DNA-binding LytR/AlgR family response regulator
LTEFNIDDIYFFEYIKKRYVKICSKSGDYHFNEKIGKIDIDMASYNFFMPHQSFVVNLKYVKDIKNYELLMTNGIRIPLSQKRAVLFRNALNNYLEKMLIL